MAFVLFNRGDLVGGERELLRCIDLASRRDETHATYLLGLTKYYRGSSRRRSDWACSATGI